MSAATIEGVLQNALSEALRIFGTGLRQSPLQYGSAARIHGYDQIGKLNSCAGSLAPI